MSRPTDRYVEQHGTTLERLLFRGGLFLVIVAVIGALDRLARALKLDRPAVNDIHAEVGVTKLYN